MTVQLTPLTEITNVSEFRNPEANSSEIPDNQHFSPMEISAILEGTQNLIAWCDTEIQRLALETNREDLSANIREKFSKSSEELIYWKNRFESALSNADNIDTDTLKGLKFCIGEHKQRVSEQTIININTFSIPEANSSEIPDNLINFSPTIDDNQHIPPQNDPLNNPQPIKSEPQENDIINTDNEVVENDSQSLFSSWSADSNQFSQNDVYSLYVVPHIGSNDTSAIKDGIQNLTNWYKSESTRLISEASQLDSEINFKLEFAKRTKLYDTWKDSLELSLVNAEAKKVEKRLLRDLNSFVDNQYITDSVPHKSPLKRRNNSPIVSSSPPKMFFETHTNTASETQTAKIEVVNKTPQLREIRDEELEETIGVGHTKFESAFDNVFGDSTSKSSTNRLNFSFSNNASESQSQTNTINPTGTKPKIFNFNSDMTRKTVRIPEETPVIPSIPKPSEKPVIFDSNPAEKQYNLKKKLKTISSQTEEHRFEDEMKDQNDRIEYLEKTTKNLENINSALVTKNTLLLTEIDKRDDLINTANSEIQTLKNKITNYDKAFENIEIRSKVFDDKYNSLHNKHESLNKEFGKLQKEENTWNSTLTKERQNSQYFSKELGKANSKIEDLVKEITHYREELTKLQSEKESIGKPQSELQTKYEEAIRLLSHLQLEYKHLQDINNSLKIENEKTPMKSPSYSINNDNRSQSGIQTDTTDQSSTEEPNKISSSKPRKYSKKRNKSGGNSHKKSAENTNTGFPPNNPNFGPNGIFVTSTPLGPNTQENTLPKSTNIPQNNSVPLNPNIPLNFNIDPNAFWNPFANAMINALGNLNNNNTSNPPQNYDRPVVCKLEPKEFDGTVAEAAEWLRDFNMIAENNRWKDPQRYRCAKVKMTKNAKNWILTEFKNHNDPSFTAYTTEAEPTWEIFCDKFLAHFRPPGCEYVLEDQLKLLTRQVTETYTEYIMRFLTNARQANALMPDEKIVFLFKKSLQKDPIISSITSLRDLNLIKDALRNFDEIQSSDQIIKKPIEPNTRIEKSWNYNQNRTSEAQPPNPTQPPNLKNTPKYRGKPNISAKEFIKCFNCGENGHRKTECKLPVNKKLVEEWQKYVKATKDGDYSLPRPKTSAANTLRNTSNNSKMCELGHNDPHYFEYAESDLEEDP